MLAEAIMCRSPERGDLDVSTIFTCVLCAPFPQKLTFKNWGIYLKWRSWFLCWNGSMETLEWLLGSMLPSLLSQPASSSGIRAEVNCLTTTAKLAAAFHWETNLAVIVTWLKLAFALVEKVRWLSGRVDSVSAPCSQLLAMTWPSSSFCLPKMSCTSYVGACGLQENAVAFSACFRTPSFAMLVENWLICFGRISE